MDKKCDNCPRVLDGDGDLYVRISLKERRSDMPSGEGDFAAKEANLTICLVCFDDNWRLHDSDGDPKFYSTDKDGVAYAHQAHGR